MLTWNQPTKSKHTGHNMKRKIQIMVMLVLAVCFLSSCAALAEKQKNDYGVLKSAVMFSSDKVIGKYGDTIPDDFNSLKFMEFVKGKIPEDYYHALEIYRLDVKPRSSYYLIKVFKNQTMILFDYSCTPEVDGPVLDSPEKYDLNNLDKYDQCR